MGKGHPSLALSRSFSPWDSLSVGFSLSICLRLSTYISLPIYFYVWPLGCLSASLSVCLALFSVFPVRFFFSLPLFLFTSPSSLYFPLLLVLLSPSLVHFHPPFLSSRPLYIAFPSRSPSLPSGLRRRLSLGFGPPERAAAPADAQRAATHADGAAFPQ